MTAADAKTLKLGVRSVVQAYRLAVERGLSPEEIDREVADDDSDFWEDVKRAPLVESKRWEVQ